MGPCLDRTRGVMPLVHAVCRVLGAVLARVGCVLCVCVWVGLGSEVAAEVELSLARSALRSCADCCGGAELAKGVNG